MAPCNIRKPEAGKINPGWNELGKTGKQRKEWRATTAKKQEQNRRLIQRYVERQVFYLTSLLDRQQQSPYQAQIKKDSKKMLYVKKCKKSTPPQKSKNKPPTPARLARMLLWPKPVLPAIKVHRQQAASVPSHLLRAVAARHPAAPQPCCQCLRAVLFQKQLRLQCPSRPCR